MMTDQPTDAQALEIIQGRASSYAFLSYVYRREVTASFLSALVDQLEGEPQEAASDGHRVLRRYIAEIGRSELEKVQKKLATEYAALFLNTGRNPVFPYESVYTSPEHLVMQRARDEVLAEYRKEGLDRVEDFREPEDHVAIELEFMAHLCQQTAEALEFGDMEAALASLEKQREFLDKHLLMWVPQFCHDLAKAARSDFYRGVAEITEEHLADEGETIAELVAALENTRER